MIIIKIISAIIAVAFGIMTVLSEQEVECKKNVRSTITMLLAMTVYCSAMLITLE